MLIYHLKIWKPLSSYEKNLRSVTEQVKGVQVIESAEIALRMSLSEIHADVFDSALSLFVAVISTVQPFSSPFEKLYPEICAEFSLRT